MFHQGKVASNFELDEPAGKSTGSHKPYYLVLGLLKNMYESVILVKLGRP